VLEVGVERLGRDTSFGKIIDAVKRAERSQAPVQNTADRYGGYVIYFALARAPELRRERRLDGDRLRLAIESNQ
jgi:cation transport ATPase